MADQDAKLRREAVDWVSRLTSHAVTKDDLEALELWRRESPAHAAAFLDARRLWHDLESAGSNIRHETVSDSLVIARRKGVSAGRRAFLGGGMAAAAAVGAFMLVRPPLGLWPSWSELAADYRTGTGEQREIQLGDDVSVHLNTQTSIVLQDGSSSSDKIELLTGEASFAIAPRTERALEVRVADLSIEAGGGGKFDVRYLPVHGVSTVCVTCLAGSVSVARGTQVVSIGAHQQIQYDANGLKPSASVDPEIVSAWQRGILIFRFTPLDDVVAEINRYRPGKIIVLNATLGRTLVSGRFKIDNLNEALMRVEQVFGAKVRSMPGGVVLLS